MTTAGTASATFATQQLWDIDSTLVIIMVLLRFALLVLLWLFILWVLPPAVIVG